MCHDLDSRPPIAPIAGGALDGQRMLLTGSDGNILTAFRARPSQADGNGVVILPDVRGLHPFYEELALRSRARHRRPGHRLLRADRRYRRTRRGLRPHAPRSRRLGQASRGDIAAGVEVLRREGIERIFTIGFCMGGRMSFLASTSVSTSWA